MQTLIKNTRAYKLLKAETAKNRLAHAYLVLLDDGRNLRAALKTFAKILFGVDEPLSPAQKRIADLIEAESFSDCLFFPAPDKKFMVEDAEKIAEESALKAVEGEKKVFVVGDFAEATIAAQNKLLKLLEEPPQGVVFLLGATTAFPVLSTVLSRVEKLEIPPFSVEEISACLTRFEGGRYATNDIQLASAACGGSLGAAQNALEGGGYKTVLDDALSLCLAAESALPALVRKIGETKNKQQLLSMLRIVFRDALLIKTGVAGILLQSERGRLGAIAKRFTTRALLYAQEALTKAEREVFFNAVFPQCLETLMAGVIKENQL